VPGIRIQHSTERNATFTLVDGGRRYSVPWTCPPPPDGCARTHEYKTYHFRLDETGAAIVSLEIWERLQRIPGNPFALANEVKAPPAQLIRVPTTLVVPRPLSPGGLS
jgi:hypothetical protein